MSAILFPLWEKPVLSLPRQAVCAICAAGGFIRFEIGVLLLRNLIGRHRNDSPDALFDRAWRWALRFGFLFRGAALFRNGFGYPWKDILFLRLLEEMQGFGVAYMPRLRLLKRELLLQAADSPPLILVTVHSPVDAILNRVFEECGIRWTLLAARERAAQRARLLGLRTEVDIVERSSNTLLVLRQKLREGKLVAADVDYARRRRNSLYCDVFMSPAMFRLAAAVNAKVLYAKTRVNGDGLVEVEFGSPAVAANECTARDHAVDFMDWLRENQGDRRPWRIQEWSPKKKDKFRKLVLTEGLCPGRRSRACH